MRFSAVFQLPLASRLTVDAPAPARVEEPAAPMTPVPPARLVADLPEDLDQRVRMVGEWQLGED
jgi:hypothetical protein